MAGKRQHYVPRLLQRGFLHDPTEEAERTWLHRRSAKSKLVGICDVGVEDWFYSRKPLDGQPTLDDLITDIEGDLSATVNDLRATPPGATVNPDVAARCVVHLVMRTGHLRSLMSKGISRLTDEIQSLVTDPSRLAKVFGLNSPALAPRITQAIRDAALELAPFGIPPAFAERLMSVLIRESGDDLVRNAASTLAPLFPQLFGDLASRVRDAHNRVLETPHESNGWVTSLSSFCWTIEAGEELILPDAIALAAEATGRLVPLLFTGAADVRGVVMPISRNRILVGVPPGQDPIDLAQFNRQAAASCEGFFICARPYDDDDLTSLIGSGPATAIQNAIEEAVSSVEAAGVATPAMRASSHDNTFEQNGFAYSVRLADYGDEALAQQLGEVLQSVVGELSRRLPLHDLDGFTIAMNYQAALAGLDRGDETLPPVTSSALEYGVGVAMPVTVRRDGAPKEHIVIDASIAQAWISEDIESRAGAISVLVKMLASVAHTTRFAREAVTFKPDPMTAELHPAVAAAPSCWFGARESAFVAPHLGQAYADLVVESLEFAERQIATERAQSSETGDISNVTRRALECVSATLRYAADWLGHRAGLADGQGFEGEYLPVRLQSRGLDKWLELFGRDLAAIYETEGAGLNLSIVTRLSQHVERLLWALGIYAWPEEDGIRCLVHAQGFIPPRLA
jgi:hypothetical protein